MRRTATSHTPARAVKQKSWRNLATRRVPAEVSPRAAEDNLTRRYGQLTRPDGRAPRDAATVTGRTVRGLRVTAVGLPGTYLGGTPGSAPRPGGHDRRG